MAARTQGFVIAPGQVLPGSIEQAGKLAGLFQSGALPAPTENDIFAVWIGGNNFLSAAGGGGLPDIEAGVNDVATTLGTLAFAGAEKFLLFNLPLIAGATASDDLSLLINDATRAFNDGLRQVDQQISGQFGVDVLYINIEALLEDAQLNPSVYGFTEVEDDCVSNGLLLDACPATWSDYDGIHPTRQVHALIADFVLASGANVDGAANAIIASTDVVLGLGAEVRDLAYEAAREGRGTRGAYVVGSLIDGEIDPGEARGGSDYDGMLVAAGIETYLPNENYFAGIQAGYGEADADATGLLSGSSSLDGYFVSAYTGYADDRFYGILTAGVSQFDLELARSTGFAARSSVTGESEMTGFHVAFGGGYTHDLGAFALEPFGRLSFSKYKLNEYQEEGALFAADVAEVEFDSFEGRAGLRGHWASEDDRFKASLTGAVVQEFEGSRRVEALLNGVDLSIAEAGAPADTSGLLGARVSAEFIPGLIVSAAYEGRVGEDLTGHTVRAGAGVRF